MKLLQFLRSLFGLQIKHRKNAESCPFKIVSDELLQVRVEVVLDGDTVVVSKGMHSAKLRLDAIDCPEDDQPWGDIAKAGLIKLIGGRPIWIERHGLDRYGRTVATIFVKDGDKLVNVNEKMVNKGHAWVMRQYYLHLHPHRRSKLNQLERWAKQEKVGLWKTEKPIPPWEWRKRNSA